MSDQRNPAAAIEMLQPARQIACSSVQLAVSERGSELTTSVVIIDA